MPISAEAVEMGGIFTGGQTQECVPVQCTGMCSDIRLIAIIYRRL